MQTVLAAGRRFVLALLGSQDRLSYRRLLVFATGTALLCAGKLDSGTWLWVALAYLGTEIAERLVKPR